MEVPTSSSPEQKLCASCERVVRCFLDAAQLDQQYEERSGLFAGSHHETGISFFTAARENCQICDKFLRYHLRAHGSLDNSFNTVVDGTKQPGSTDAAWSGKLFFTIDLRDGKGWKPNSRFTQLRASIFLQGDPRYAHLRDTCQFSELSNSSRDASVMDLANKWLNSCVTGSPGHEDCSNSAKRAFRPARLLDVSGETARLSLRDERVEQEPYCALSYCWGDSEQVMLTASNEGAFCNVVEISTLPKSIQDAIKVTRALGFRYIWVDCLCIIQSGDNGKDWQIHCNEMRDVYSNCTLNLSADRARTAEDGFLGQRNWPALRPIFINGDTTGTKPQKDCVIVFDNVVDMALATEPLASRAWVFSERILSPRTLHFAAGEVFWECSGVILASESCPQGFSTTMESTMYPNFKLSGTDDEDSDDIYDWTRILNSYSLLSLTMPASDKLVALASVGKLYEERTGNTLLAGIVKGALPHSLLWQREFSSSVQTQRSRTYRAPSWSWANFDGPLFFYGSKNYYGRASKIAEVLEVWTKSREGHSHLGQLEDGSITLHGPLLSLTDLESFESFEAKRLLELHWDDPDDEKTKDITFAIILNASAFANSDDARGLLINPGEMALTWVRVGVFSVTWQEKSSLDPSSLCLDCQAFTKHVSKKTVKIV